VTRGNWIFKIIGEEYWVRRGWKYAYSWFSAADGVVEITK
jgi:hypothetical protein